MRLNGGRYNGIVLKAPPEHLTRPTLGRVRQSVFNVLQHADFCPPLQGAYVLDLCAGSGQMGIQALSFGAAYVVFVENHPHVLPVLRGNLGAIKITDRADIVADNAIRFLHKQTDNVFDIIFCDPPYEQDILEDILKTPALVNRLNQGGCMVCELPSDKKLPNLPNGWVQKEYRKWGQCACLFIGKAE